MTLPESSEIITKYVSFDSKVRCLSADCTGTCCLGKIGRSITAVMMPWRNEFAIMGSSSATKHTYKILFICLVRSLQFP